LCVAFDAALPFFGFDVFFSTAESPFLSYLFTLVANVVNESCSSRSASSRALRFPALFPIHCGVFMCSSSLSATWLPAKPSARRYDPATCSREPFHVNTLPSLSAQPTSNITWPEVAVAAPLLRAAVCLIGSCHHHIAAARRAESCFWRCAPLYWFSVLSFETTSIKSHIHIHVMLYLRPSRRSWLCAPSTCVAILKR
jgi:hypothetical protein